MKYNLPDCILKLDNFANCLSVLENADYKLAETNDIYTEQGLSDNLILLLNLRGRRNTTVRVISYKMMK